MSPNIAFFQAFGHISLNWIKHNKTCYGYDSQDSIIAHNARTALGIIPGVGVGIAIERWYIVSHLSEDEDLSFKIGMIVRGIFEFLGLGLIVLLFVDIPVDIGRYCCKKNDSSPETKKLDDELYDQYNYLVQDVNSN